jgi:hypothetical protein
MCKSCNQPIRALLPELEEMIQTEAPRPKLMVNPKKVRCTGFPRDLMPQGVTDLPAYLEKVVERAVEMLTFTIDELTRIQKRVWAGDQPGFPLIGDAFGTSLARRMRINVEDRASWRGAGPGKAGLVIRWLTRMRDLLASGDLRYECLNKDPDCGQWVAAWVTAPLNDDILKDPNRPDFYQIHLCRIFWTPEIKGNASPISPKTQLEFQAQVIIHEVSHIYYTTSDFKGVGPGVAECLAQFVAETNGSPANPGLADRCK